MNRLDHNLDQVTIMWPYYYGQFQDEKNNYVNNLKSLNSGCPIKLINTDNHNDLKSLYQWHKAFEVLGDRFDYSILVEDDFFPVLSNFDKKCISLIELKKADIIFSHIHKNRMAFSASTNIICKSDVFCKAYMINKTKNWQDFVDNCNIYNIKISDLVPQYKVPIWGYKDYIVDYNIYGKVEMFVPYQWFFSHKSIDIGGLIDLKGDQFEKQFKLGMLSYLYRIRNKLEFDMKTKLLPVDYDGHVSLL